VSEHTAGSFIVTLAPLASMLAATRRKKDPPLPRPADTTTLGALAPETRRALRALAERSLENLGAPLTEELVTDEMGHQFSRLVKALGSGADREQRLRAAIATATEELTDQ
jgi:hypothetical protein